MSSFTKQVRDWFSGFSRRRELDRLNKFELSRIAGDAGASIDELYQLSRRGPAAAALLPRRLRALGLDEAKMAHDEPATLRDMQRLCAFCGSRSQCARDLEHDAEGAFWQTYCPNTATMRALLTTARPADKGELA